MPDRTMPPKPPNSDKYLFGERSERCLAGLHPHLIALVRRALELSTIDFGIHCGVRSPMEQRRMFQEGRSKILDGRHVPMPVRSGGNGLGHALDAHVWLPGRPDDAFDWPLLMLINVAFTAASKQLQVPYNWGGEWKTFPDGPHFELPSEVYPKDGPVGPMPLDATAVFEEASKPKSRTRRGKILRRST